MYLRMQKGYTVCDLIDTGMSESTDWDRVLENEVDEKWCLCHDKKEGEEDPRNQGGWIQ